MIAVAIWAAEATARERLAALLADEPGLQITGTAASATALQQIFGRAPIDVILADSPADGELAAVALARQRKPLILLTDENDEKRLAGLLRAGAMAVLPRHAETAKLRIAIDAACLSLSLLPRPLLETLLDDTRGDPDSIAAETPSLTPRELEVLNAMADGAANKVIARRLGISVHTVKFHVASILAKLDADSRTEAVLEAARRGLVML